MIQKKFTVLLMFLSQNAYSQFEIIPTFTNANLSELHFYDNECFILGNQHYLAKCGQNGDNLVLKSVPGQSNYWFQYFNRIDTNTAYSVSYYPSFQSGNYDIYKTNDNCENWELVYTAPNGTAGGLVMFDSMEGLHDNNNLTHTINRTLDSCVNWQNETTYPYSDLHIYDTYGDSTICAGFVENFSISYDRGHTWISHYYLQTQPTSFEIISKDTILSTAFGYFLKTFDHGLNWEQIYFPLLTNKVKHLKADTIYIVGALGIQDELGNYISHGAIMRSLDFGETWETYDTGIETEFYDIVFTNDSIALISGTNGILIKYNYRDHHLGFKEVETKSFGIEVYPNPTSGIFELKNGSGIDAISVLDLSGKPVKEFSDLNESGTGNIQLDISDLPTGFYQVVLLSKEEITTMKLIKK